MKYTAIGIIFCFFLVNGAMAEEINADVLKNQNLQVNGTDTIEELMKNKDWKRIAELMNQEKTTVQAQTNGIESSIKPAASNKEWNKWFAPKEEGFIVVACGG